METKNNNGVRPGPMLALALIAIAAGAGTSLLLDAMRSDRPAGLAHLPAEGAGIEAPGRGTPSPARRPSTAGAPRGMAGAHVVEEAVPRSVEQRLSELDEQFWSDPVDAAWAGAREQEILFLLDEAAGTLAGVEVLSKSVACRSQSCRINFRVADILAADDLATQLQLEIGTEFSRTMTVPIRREDGTHELHVFATTAAGSHLLASRQTGEVQDVGGR